MDDIQQATKDLKTLTETVIKFADWWLRMDNVLAKVDIREGALTAGGKNKLNFKDIKKSWVEIRGDHEAYKQRVCIGAPSLKFFLTGIL